MKRSGRLPRRTPLRQGCGKRRYPTQEAAEWALVNARDTHTAEGRAKVEQRAYQCGRCDGWHLTSWTSSRRQRTPSTNAPDGTTRGLVLARDGMACVSCGHPVLGQAYSVHHRLPRGRGGPNTPDNLVTLCGSGTTGCHGDVEDHRQVAYELGMLVHTGQDPATVAVRCHDGWWHLQVDGSRIPAAPGAGVFQRARDGARPTRHATGEA